MVAAAAVVVAVAKAVAAGAVAVGAVGRRLAGVLEAACGRPAATVTTMYGTHRGWSTVQLGGIHKYVWCSW